MEMLSTQFGHPQGLVGWFAGQMMALEHGELTRWAVDLLDLVPNDRVLEIGFGPGTAIQQMAQRVRHGLVAGVDVSEVMVNQARARNAAAIREGRVDLRQGSAAALPFAANQFAKALVVNSLHHWSNPLSGLEELRRVLRPGGLVAIVDRPHEAKTEDAVEKCGEQTFGMLRSAGFRALCMIPGLQGSAVGVLGTR